MLIYDASIPHLKRALKNLAHILKKGEAHAQAKEISTEVFFNARLFPDMYPLYRQVQIATDMSKGAAARLSGTEIPKYEDNETTFAELQERIAKTISFLDSIKPEQVEGAENCTVELMVRKQRMEFSGQDYLFKWVYPNVFFHITTAYDILRHNGVELGKPDYLRGGD